MYVCINSLFTFFSVPPVLRSFFSIYSGGASTYLGAGAVSVDPAVEKSATQGLQKMLTAGRRLAVTTWNIAAINNNPFEYWITYPQNPEYEKLMINIEQFLESPGDKDVAVKQVFTEEMFTKLDSRLTGVGWTSVRSYWEEDFRDRKIISGFMKVRKRNVILEQLLCTLVCILVWHSLTTFVR
jgi:hypothetical protein